LWVVSLEKKVCSDGVREENQIVRVGMKMWAVEVRVGFFVKVLVEAALWVFLDCGERGYLVCQSRERYSYFQVLDFEGIERGCRVC